MGKIPVVSGQDIVRVFQRIGYEVNHQTGSHIIVRRIVAPHRHASIPNHREVAKGTLRGLIRDAGLSVGEFTRLLSK